MKSIVIAIVGICVVTTSVAAETKLSDMHGRYQITASTCPDDKKCVAFGIDTATGAVFACEYRFTPGIYDFGGQCKTLPMRDETTVAGTN